MNSEIKSYILSQKAEILSLLKALVKIPSVRGESRENAPFGEECKKALKFSEKIFSENGFKTVVDLNGGYLLSEYGNGNKTIGLFAHSDVVSPGEGWTFTKPFDPIEKDGFLIGRGTLDNKSAIVLSLYVMKAIRELKLPIKSKIVTFVGSNEETGMQDINEYLKKNTPPDFALVPDTWFPVFRGDKGRLLLNLTSRFRFDSIAEFYGGDSVNAVLGVAYAKVKKPISDFPASCPENIKMKADGDCTVITAKGISKHASDPEGSLNAGYVLSSFLSACASLTENDRSILKFLSALLNDNYGKTLNISVSDDTFGSLTCTNGTIRTDDGKISFTLDIRHGTSIDKDTIISRSGKFFEENGFDVEIVSSRPPFAIDKNDKFVTALLDTYKEYTKSVQAEAYINGGGTYACRLPYALEVGPCVGHKPSFFIPEGHGRVHQPDEMISVDGFLEGIELVTEMLFRCDKILND